MRRKDALRRLRHDAMFIMSSVLVALVLLNLGVLSNIISFAEGDQLLGAFIAGIFFVSSFTSAMALIAIVAISLNSPPVLVALAAAAGASLGDLFIFLFVRDRLSRDIRTASACGWSRAFLTHFRGGFTRWIAPILGALIIASPLPDEYGVALFSISRVRVAYFVPLTFALDFVGIWAIAYVAHIL